MKKMAFLLLLVLSLFFTGCTGDNKEQPPKTQSENPVQPAEKIKVTLYFANETADALVPQEREIDKPKDLVATLINELKKPDKLAPVLPEGTELLSHKSEGDILTLNFNQAFANLQGSTGEIITVNSIVNTMTELPEYKSVLLQVEGEPLATGHAIYDQPLPRNESVIQK